MKIPPSVGKWSHYYKNEFILTTPFTAKGLFHSVECFWYAILSSPKRYLMFILYVWCWGETFIGFPHTSVFTYNSDCFCVVRHVLPLASFCPQIPLYPSNGPLLLIGYIQSEGRICKKTRMMEGKLCVPSSSQETFGTFHLSEIAHQSQNHLYKVILYTVDSSLKVILRIIRSLQKTTFCLEHF